MNSFIESKNYDMWQTIPDDKRCTPCKKMHGKIYRRKGKIRTKIKKKHLFCRCIMVALKAMRAGTATTSGTAGADWYLKYMGKLPSYYITEQQAKELGWKNKNGNLNEVAPGKMLAKGIYKNADEKLPGAPGRIWYEADINYKFGFRGQERILFSNDGLIFVTYDHYETFVEII